MGRERSMQSISTIKRGLASSEPRCLLVGIGTGVLTMELAGGSEGCIRRRTNSGRQDSAEWPCSNHSSPRLQQPSHIGLRMREGGVDFFIQGRKDDCKISGNVNHIGGLRRNLDAVFLVVFANVLS